MDIDNDVIYSDQESEKRRQERQKRRDERRQKNKGRKKVLAFIYGAKEMAPIIQSSITESGVIDYKDIAKKVKEQSNVLESISEEILGEDHADEKIQLQSSIAASKLAALGNTDRSTIVSIIKMLSEFNDTKSDIIEKIDQGFFSSDVLVNIKLQMIPYVYEFNKSLTVLTNDEDLIREYTSWLTNTGAHLAKDVAFNWDKKSTYRDRENLFVMMLPTCMEVSMASFYEYISTYHGASRPSNMSLPLSGTMPQLNNAIIEMDMGYAHHETLDMSWLTKTLGVIIADRVTVMDTSEVASQHRGRINGGIVSDIDNIAAESWKSASNKFIEMLEKEIDGLSDEEVENLMATKYSDPMPLDDFIKAFHHNMDRWPGLIDPISINMDEVSRFAEKRMSTLWGLTDAMCKLRTK